MLKKIAALILGVFMALTLCAPAAYAIEFETGPAPAGFRPLPLELEMMRLGLSNINVFTDSILVFQEGRIIYERHARGWDRNTPHRMYSVTKSVLSALVGIAIGDGKIEGVQQKVIDFYPDAVIAPGQEAKRDITVEQLLTHSAGLPGDGDIPGAEWWVSTGDTYDSGRAAFETPQVAAPGERYAYNSGAGMQTLACLVSRAVGMNLFEYAKLKLFDPLGMDSVAWDAADDGSSYGGFGITMSIEDMLRIGLLYLNEGAWEGTQIIPADYIAATRPPSALRENYGYLWRTYTDDDENALRAAGFFGQFICVMPAENTVIVRTGSAGPMMRTIARASLRWPFAEWLAMKIIYPLAPLKGIPLRYFMETT